MKNVLHFEDYTNTQKVHQIKEKARQKVEDFSYWLQDHKEEIVTYGPIVLAIGTAVLKTTVKHINFQRQENLKNLYCYDRSLGHYWRLKRQLSNREWLAIESRRKNGERLCDILSSMNVLK